MAAAVARSKRAIGVDLGSRRIGIATSDTSGTIASPLTVIRRGGSAPRDLEAIAGLAVEYEAVVVVVGLPLTLRGEHGSAARAATREAEALATLVDVPVELHDERLTTVSADRMARQVGRRPDRETEIDKLAAAVMLQSWLDGPAAHFWESRG